MTNVALIVLDTLRKDKFDEHFSWLPGMRFENAWAPSHYTVPVHSALFTGKYPSEIGVHAKSERLDYPEPVLAERLQKQQFTTRALSENLLLSPLNDFDRGFDTFRSIGESIQINQNIFNWDETLRNLDGDSVIRDARAIIRCLLSDSDILPSLKVGWKMKQDDFNGLDEAEHHIREMEFGNDEFLFLNLMQAHGPYNPPKSYATVECDQYTPSGAETLLGGDADFNYQWEAYDDCVRYLSDGYEDIFAELQQDFDYIITISDHGELFGEHGARQHWHGIYPELTHVPVVISGEELSSERNNETVSLLDVHETIQHMAGIDAPSRGRNLLDDIESQTWLVEYHGLRENRRKMLRDRGYSEKEIDKYDVELLGLAVPSDYYGFETVDGFKERGNTTVPDPQAEMRRLSESLERRTGTAQTDEVPDAVKIQLERLGYA